MRKPENLVITLNKILISCSQGVDRVEDSSGSHDDAGLGSDCAGSGPEEEADTSQLRPSSNTEAMTLKFEMVNPGNASESFQQCPFPPAPGLCPRSSPLSRGRARHPGHLDSVQNVPRVLYINGIT